MANKTVFPKRIAYFLIWAAGLSSIGHTTGSAYFHKFSTQVASRFVRKSLAERPQQPAFSIKSTSEFYVWQLWEIPDGFTMCRRDKIRGFDWARHRVLVVGNKPVAGCSYAFNTVDGDAHISALGVDPAYQGKQYGKFLFSYVIEELDRFNIKEIDLVASGGYQNPAAMKLYVQHGFKIIDDDLDNPLMRRRRTGK